MSDWPVVIVVLALIALCCATFEYDGINRTGDLLLQYTSHIAEALRSLMNGTSLAADPMIAINDTDALIDAGLGPVFFDLLRRSDRLAEIDTDMKFRASDLTSRAISAEQFGNLEYVIALLQSAEIFPVLLKGASIAMHYYPEPHQRVMGDVDLLLPADRVDHAEAILVGEGFTKAEPAPGVDYQTHIHSAPLNHPGRNVWIELHRRLLKDAFAPSREKPLNLSGMQQELERACIGKLEVARFCTEFELVYLASCWCYDMTGGFARTGIQRGLFDATLMLKSSRDQLDWDKVLRWSENSLTGACLLVLLSFLRRIEVFDDVFNICDTLGERQSFVNGVTLSLMHKRIEKHLLHLSGYGLLASAKTTSNMFDALIRKESAWKNLASVPGNILFPRREERRFELGYQFSRIRSVLGRGR